MNRDVVVLVAEDDPGHAVLVERNLRRAGLVNDIRLFTDGQEILDFLFGEVVASPELRDTQYLLLLDIRMPKIDGTEVLRRVKSDERLRRIPCVMLTTTDDPRKSTNAIVSVVIATLSNPWGPTGSSKRCGGWVCFCRWSRCRR